MTIACFAKDGVGAARDESPRLSFIQVGEHVEPFTTIRELAPLFSPNRHGTCEDADNLSFDQVGIRLLPHSNMSIYCVLGIYTYFKLY